MNDEQGIMLMIDALDRIDHTLKEILREIKEMNADTQDTLTEIWGARSKT